MIDIYIYPDHWEEGLGGSVSQVCSLHSQQLKTGDRRATDAPRPPHTRTGLEHILVPPCSQQVKDRG